MTPEVLATKIHRAIREVQKVLPPNTGVTLFVFDFGPEGGVGYISNAAREDTIKVIEEWLSRIDPKS